MKIVIASDKFKNCLSSKEVNMAIGKGLKKVLPECEVACIEMADGGEGSLEVFRKTTGAGTVHLYVKDPLGREIAAEYLYGNGVAFIEMARASGLCLLKEEEYNPLIATSLGLGQMIFDAVDREAEHIIIGIGGSATNDGGAGMLSALGYGLLDASGNVIAQGGAPLNELATITPGPATTRLEQIRFEVATDVNNPLLGTSGATNVFSAQKGANSSMRQILEKGLENFSKVTKNITGIDYSIFPGTGAAGGVGFALKAFLGAELSPGWSIMASLAGLEEKIANSDLVITGEGSLDTQSLGGKLVSGIMELCHKYNKPLWIFCGVNSLNEESLNKMIKIFPLSLEEPNIEASVKNAKIHLENISEKAATFLTSNKSNLQTN